VTYRIEYLPAAVKDLRKLDKSVARRIVRKLTEVETDPYAFATTELVDRPGVRRLKIGDYRVLYTVEKGKMIIWVIEIGHRSEIY